MPDDGGYKEWQMQQTIDALTAVAEQLREHHKLAVEQWTLEAQRVKELEDNVHELRAEVEALNTTWISVEDDMPEEEGTYLCRFMDGAIETFPCENENLVGFKDWGVAGCQVTHWMPLPEPPALRGEVGK